MRSVQLKYLKSHKYFTKNMQPFKFQASAEYMQHVTGPVKLEDT